MVHRTREAASVAARGKASGRVRIIGGAWKRRLLAVVDAPGLRPTPDRVRETLFNWLTHALGGDLRGRSALDLFAGSGALGFEAGSRGAGPVILVETNQHALGSLREAKVALGADQVEIRSGDAFDVARRLRGTGAAFDIVFVDPPFGADLVQRAVAAAQALLSPAGYVYLESGAAFTADAAADQGLELVRADRAGDVFYHLLQRNKNNREETA